MCRTSVERRVVKISSIAGEVPTIPASDDHTDGSWIATDVYVGEQFFNSADGIMYTRSSSGIEFVGGGAGAIKEYFAIITQTGTSAPTVDTLIKNTIGSVSFAYDNPGEFALNSASLFPSNKTVFSIVPSPTTGTVLLYWNSASKIYLKTVKDGGGAFLNGQITKATIHIIVLP